MNISTFLKKYYNKYIEPAYVILLIILAFYAGYQMAMKTFMINGSYNFCKDLLYGAIIK